MCSMYNAYITFIAECFFVFWIFVFYLISFWLCRSIYWLATLSFCVSQFLLALCVYWCYLVAWKFVFMMRKSEMKNVFNVETVEPNGQPTHIRWCEFSGDRKKKFTIDWKDIVTRKWGSEWVKWVEEETKREKRKQSRAKSLALFCVFFIHGDIMFPVLLFNYTFGEKPFALRWSILCSLYRISSIK